MNEGNNNDKIERIIVTCPNPECQQRLRLPKIHRLLEVKCPECGTVFRYNYDAFQKVSRVFIKTKPEEGVKWYYRRWAIILFLILFPPMGIGLMWGGSRFQRSTKVLITIILGFLLLTWYYSQRGIFSLLIPLVPIGIILLWARLKLQRPAKVWLTIILVFSSIWLTKHSGLFLDDKIYLPPADSILIDELDMQIFEKRAETEKIKTIPQIVEVQGSGVVSIETDKGQGSGFIISQSGIIVTNYHVLKGVHSVQITLTRGDVYNDVSLIAADRKKDLALIKIGASGLPTINLGDSDDVKVGQPVVAIGNPLGLKDTVTEGIISAIRDFKKVKILQTNAAVSPGSSGGPLFNMCGEAIGITSASVMWGQNLNFAIPINELKLLIKTEKTFIEMLGRFPELSRKEIRTRISIIEKRFQEEKTQKSKSR
jgi:uncharacterized C2H2 Zn-finger protein